MIKYFFIICLMISGVSAQNKYLVTFKDKGTAKPAAKISGAAIAEAEESLTERAIERRKKVMGESFITYEDLPIYQPYIDRLKLTGAEIVHELKWFNAASVILKESELYKIESQPFVKAVRRVKKLPYKRPQFYNSSPQTPAKVASNLYDYGYSLKQTSLSDIPRVHNAGITGKDVLIGILDTGFDWKDHPALRNRKVAAERDFVFNDEITQNQSGDTYDQHNHGTLVFSILAGFDPGSLIGPAFDATFLLAKTENVGSETHAEEDNYAAALEWMENLGVDITTSSLGYNTFDEGSFSYDYEDMDGNTTIVTRAAKLAFERGVSTVTSAGNEGNDPWYYITAPADENNIIAVGAVNSENKIAGFSSHGPTADGRIKPEVTAMGVTVFGAKPGGSGYNYSNGTSLSAPIVSGIAGLLLSEYPHLTNRQMRNIIIEAAGHPANPDNETGYGLLSAKRAIEYPNLRSENGLYIINKVFLDTLNNNSVELMIREKNETGFTGYSLTKQDLIYSFEISEMFSMGDTLEFYYNYSNKDGQLQRSPFGNSLYKMVYGGNDVFHQTGIETDIAPDGYVLEQNFPNPFNNETTIMFYLPEISEVNLTVYNILGQKIRTLVNGQQREGWSRYTWNGRTDSGYPSSSGVYVYVLRHNGKLLSNKMVYVK